jgi:hypothetical protein
LLDCMLTALFLEERLHSSFGCHFGVLRGCFGALGLLICDSGLQCTKIDEADQSTVR